FFLVPPLKKYLLRERSNDDPVERAVSESRVTVIYFAQRNCFGNQVIQVHPALQVQPCINRDVTLHVSGPEIHTYDALLATDRTKDVQTDVNFGLCHTDQIESTADGKHGQPLFSHGLQSHEVKAVIRTSWQKVAHGFHRFCMRGVDNISRTESLGCVESLLLEVDDNDS